MNTLSSSTLPLVAHLEHELSPVEALRRLAGLPHLVFFDSNEGFGERGRFSFLAADPFEWYSLSPQEPDHLRSLQQKWQRFQGTSIPGLPPFQGGLAGLFCYDLNQQIELLPPPRQVDFPLPTVAVGMYDVVLAFDHQTGESWIVSQGFPEVDPGARAERARARLAQLQERLFRSSYGLPSQTLSHTSLEPAPQFDVGLGKVTSGISETAYLEAVARAVEYIHAGDVFQVNLSQRLLAPAETDSLELYLRLRERNPAPYAGYFDLGDWQICSSSPECFLRVRDHQVETRPIKGTRGRLNSAEADLYVGDELSLSEKDRAENVMIVDLMRNDLSRVCEPDSLHVAGLCTVETYAHVKHLVSSVKGKLLPHGTVFDLLRASFPGGSITGAPKIRAMEIISELEPTARGAYCGSLAYIGFDGQMDSSILIRTITAGAGWWQMPVGGGIVAQSKPSEEYRETWHKARGLLKALGLA